MDLESTSGSAEAGAAGPPAEHRPAGLRDELLTTTEVAEILRTSPSTVRYWRHRGYGPQGVRAGRKVLYRASDVEAWLERLAAEEGRL